MNKFDRSRYTYSYIEKLLISIFLMCVLAILTYSTLIGVQHSNIVISFSSLKYEYLCITCILFVNIIGTVLAISANVQ